MGALRLHARDFQGPSVQNQNAGNGGDLVKHSVYLALLRRAPGGHRELHVVEAHAGKGVYVPAAEEYAPGGERYSRAEVGPGDRAGECVSASTGRSGID